MLMSLYHMSSISFVVPVVQQGGGVNRYAIREVSSMLSYTALFQTIIKMKTTTKPQKVASLLSSALLEV